MLSNLKANIYREVFVTSKRVVNCTVLLLSKISGDGAQRKATGSNTALSGPNVMSIFQPRGEITKFPALNDIIIKMH